MPDETQNDSHPAFEMHEVSAAPDSDVGGEAPAQETTNVVYCTQCGSRMRPEDLYCHACGWDVKADAPPPRPPRVVVNPSDRNRLAALLLALLLGWMGAHRFYVGKIGTGLAFLFTLGFLGVGVIYDLVLIATGEFRDEQDRRVVRWD